MREIKFRAWDSTAKKMFSPSSINFKSDSIWVCDVHGDNRLEYELVSPTSAIMQYTGLKDKNGKEIYEGDIVKYYSNTFGETYRWKVATVEYYKSYFGFNDRFWFEDEALSVHVEIPMFGHIRATIIPSDIWQSDLKRCEIIGNIYENPELLK